MPSVSQKQPVAVVGATGHTGRFVLDELARRGLRAILIGRDAHQLAALRRVHPGSAARVADCADAATLDRALTGAAAVVNCAGPFLDTALPVVDAALRARIPYLDVTAEQAAAQGLDTRDAAARHAQVVVLPAAAFYGGLADLLATTVVDPSRTVDAIEVAVALDSWHPTPGTRRTGQRNTAPRLVVRNGRLQPVPDPRPEGAWAFPAPFGTQDVVMLPFSETITLARHLRASAIDSWINVAALRDVSDPRTPPPEPSDARGRSAQRFVMDVLVRASDRHWRATAAGQDIYAVTAPIIVEALQRILTGEAVGTFGVHSLSEIVDAKAVLETLVRANGLRVHYETPASALLQRHR